MPLQSRILAPGKNFELLIAFVNHNTAVSMRLWTLRQVEKDMERPTWSTKKIKIKIKNKRKI
jgi:hypothetical protein